MFHHAAAVVTTWIDETDQTPPHHTQKDPPSCFTLKAMVQAGGARRRPTNLSFLPRPHKAQRGSRGRPPWYGQPRTAPGPSYDHGQGAWDVVRVRTYG